MRLRIGALVEAYVGRVLLSFAIEHGLEPPAGLDKHVADEKCQTSNNALDRA